MRTAILKIAHHEKVLGLTNAPASQELLYLAWGPWSTLYINREHEKTVCFDIVKSGERKAKALVMKSFMDWQELTPIRK